MKANVIALAVTATLACSCATTLPVVGQFSTTRDDFMGDVVADLNSGTLRVQSQKGLACSGTLSRPTLVSGNGTITCSDGRTGTFVFAKKTEGGGDGFGTLSDGERFRFHFGYSGRMSRTKCDESEGSIECLSY